jgi:hypothetical protein
MSMRHEKTRANARKLIDAAFERQRIAASSIMDWHESYNLCCDPTQYDWRYIGKKEMLVPYNHAIAHPGIPRGDGPAASLQARPTRWEKHQVWTVEGALCRGESNVLQRRRFYIDETSWLILLGEGFDNTGAIVKQYLLDLQMIVQGRPQGKWYNL